MHSSYYRQHNNKLLKRDVSRGNLVGPLSDVSLLTGIVTADSSKWTYLVFTSDIGSVLFRDMIPGRLGHTAVPKVGHLIIENQQKTLVLATRAVRSIKKNYNFYNGCGQKLLQDTLSGNDKAQTNREDSVKHRFILTVKSKIFCSPTGTGQTLIYFFKQHKIYIRITIHRV